MGKVYPGNAAVPTLHTTTPVAQCLRLKPALPQKSCLADEEPLIDGENLETEKKNITIKSKALSTLFK